MKKIVRVAVLSTTLALCAAPVFADPGGNDPPPPAQKGGGNGMLSPGTSGSIMLAVLTGTVG